MTEPVWIPGSIISTIHDRQIAIHGGASGVRDQGLLESAASRSVNAWLYGERDMCTLAALYGAGIIKNHPFVDGNKRTGFVAVELFLQLNGLSLTSDDEETLAAVLALAGGDIDENQFADWLRGVVETMEQGE